MEKVSIVIPCYNYAHYLSEAIESALNQTYKNIEVIVVDDGSTDDTKEVAQKYLVKLLTQSNQGLSSARNLGIAASTGEWILPLDADDLINTECVDKLLSKVKLEGADIGCPAIQEFGDKKRFLQINTKNLRFSSFKQRNYVVASCLYRKKIWDELGGYDTKMKGGHEDWDFWTRALYAGYKMAAVNEPMFFYRIHEGSMLHEFAKNHEENKRYIKNKFTDLKR